MGLLRGIDGKAARRRRGQVAARPSRYRDCRVPWGVLQPGQRHIRPGHFTAVRGMCVAHGCDDAEG